MDGMNHVCRAYLEERELIVAVRFEVLHEPDYIGKQPEELPH